MKAQIYNVLIVEDDKIDQLAFKRLIKMENLPYDLVIGESVKQAHQLLKDRRFDIIVTDYLLPDGTAFDVLEKVDDTPSIFITGAGNEDLAVKAMKSGAYDYLIKNVGRNYLQILPEVIKKAIKHKKAEDKLEAYYSHLEELVKERTEELASEKELLSVTLSSMGDGVIATDAQRRIILFNRVAEELTAFSGDFAKGRPISEILSLINEQNKEPVENPADEVLKQYESNYQFENESRKNKRNICLVDKNNNERAVSTSAAPIKKDDGSLIGTVLVLRNVSREREIERMKENFISLVSHEFRTPLTSIKAYTEMILDAPDIPHGKRAGYLEIIEKESNRLAQLSESILEISHIESGSLKLSLERLDIAHLINQTISALQPLADKKGIPLEVKLQEPLDDIVADRDKIQSMLNNLINNAIKFTPDEGRVSISAERQNDEMVITVSNTGEGIAQGEIGRIFEKFYRGSRHGRHTPGTGLGLSIVKEIVTVHGGRINVESEQNKRTTFTVFLPVSAPQAKPAEELVRQA